MMAVFVYGMMAFVLFMIVLAIKNEVAYIQSCKIIDAIQEFAYSTGKYEVASNYLWSMESYEKTLYRLWDWGCTRIVPEDVFNEIKPYIRKKGRKAK